MPIQSAHAPSSTPTSAKADGADYEPDDEWKRQLKKRIEEGLQSMVKDAKDSQAAELRKAVVSPEDRMRLEDEYKQAMNNIKALANEQYQLELNRERNQRRWTAGAPMHPDWTRYLHEEQQNIMNSIKQTTNQDASESPTDQRRPTLHTKPGNEAPSSEPPGPPPSSTPAPQPPPPPQSAPETREDRDRHSHSPPAPAPPTSARRGSDARSTASRDREDYPASNRRQHGPIHSRPTLPEGWDAADEPEDIIRPPPRSRSVAEPPPASPETGRWDSSLSRSSGSIRSVSGYMARSPPKAAPEVWKPNTPGEESAPSKPYTGLGRRGSTASIRSTGSGASIRPSITETIPERVDDCEEGSSYMDHDRDRTYEQEKTRKSSDKPREKEKRNGRRNSRPTPVDPNIYADDPSTSTPLRSAGTSTIMQFATSSPAPNKPLSSKASFGNGDDRYHLSERSAKLPPPFLDPRDQHPPPRDPLYPPRDPYSGRDPPSARPAPPRSPYGGDDRDYANGPYQNPIRPHPPKTPFGNREYPPGHVSHKPSFNYDDRRREREWEGEREREPHWDDDRDHVRDRDYEYRDWDRDRDRDRDRDIYSEPRHPGHYSYSRPAGYPTPPSTATRHASHDYLPMDMYDDREPPPPRGYGYRGHGPQPPPDDWEYPRSESTRPIPSRQPSYSRREDPERRMGEIDPYSRTYPPPHHPTGGIPIPRHAPSSEDLGVPAWREWGAENGVRRTSETRYDHQYARSPPVPEHLPRRRPAPLYNDDSPRDDLPLFGGRDRKKPHRHDDQDHDDTEEEEDAEEQPSDEDVNGIHSDGQSDEGDSLDDEMDAEAKRLEDERREADEKIKEKAAEIQRLVEEEKRLEEESKRKEEEVRRKEEEIKRKEEEAKRVEDELKKREEEAARKAKEEKRKEEEARKRQEEARRKEEQEIKRKAEEAKRLELEAARLAEEAKKKEAEVRKKEEETRRKEEKLRKDAERTKRMREEASRIAEEARQKQETLQRLEEETKKKEQEIQERERALHLREEELRKREEEAWKKEEEAKRKEAETKRKEQENRKKEADVRRKEAEAKRKEQQEARRREEEAQRKEAEARRQEELAREEEEARRQEEEEEAEAEARRQEDKARREREDRARQERDRIRQEREDRARQEREDRARQQRDDKARFEREEKIRREREERERLEQEEKDRREQESKRMFDPDSFFDDFEIDAKLMEEQTRLLQQAQFRKREEEIRRRTEERKRQDSIGHESAWTAPSTSPGVSRSPPQFSSSSSASDRLSGNSAWTTSSSAWSSSTKPSTVPSPTTARSSSSTVPPPNKPRNGSVSSGTYPTGASPHNVPPFSESEWTRRQTEFSNNQQEKFRREQEKLEAERQMRSAGKPLSREDIQRVFEQHDRLWSRLPSISEITWTDFPWPMMKPPSNPDDINFPLINAYFQSPYWPDKEKTRTLKDRIKEHLRRWHPDRFDSKTLPRVVELEKENVKEGAGNVVRYLNDLLRKENENNSSSSNLFGD